MIVENIKPCPKCGEEKEIVTTTDQWIYPYVAIWCAKCLPGGIPQLLRDQAVQLGFL